ncbi:uncharacterized protein [Diadema setosum]|uniref:uncharacterized protein n=1 Tax=Diadema setosum TaxID=31175 RepID=UPI003B3B7B39
MATTLRESDYVWMIKNLRKTPRLLCIRPMDAEQYCFEDFDFDPEPSPSFDQTSIWDSTADTTLTEEQKDETLTDDGTSACNLLNRIQDRQSKAVEVSNGGPVGSEGVKVGGSARSAFFSTKTAQRSSWSGPRSQVFATHGRSRSWDLDESETGAGRGKLQPHGANGFVRTGQGGAVLQRMDSEASRNKGTLGGSNRDGAISQSQRQLHRLSGVYRTGSFDRIDLETIGEQLQSEDKFSVRTRSDSQNVKWKSGMLSSKSHRSHPRGLSGPRKLVHSASVDSPFHSSLQSPIRPAGLIDRKDQHQAVMHAELHSKRSAEGFGPQIQDRLPHQLKGQSLDNLPSTADRIRLFGPKDLISNVRRRGSPSELSSRSSPLDLASSTDSGVSMSTTMTVESLDSLDPEMAKQLLMDVPPASLTPVSSKLKRKPIVLPSDNPDLLDKVLGVPSSVLPGDNPVLQEKVLGLPPSGRPLPGYREVHESKDQPDSHHGPNNGHRPVTRSLTAPPGTGSTEDGVGQKKPLTKTGRSIVMAAPPIFSISSQGKFKWRGEKKRKEVWPAVGRRDQLSVGVTYYQWV